MFVSLTAGISASLLLVSSEAGGEDGAQYDSSHPTWSRKLKTNAEERGHSEYFMCSQTGKSIPFAPFQKKLDLVSLIYGF